MAGSSAGLALADHAGAARATERAGSGLQDVPARLASRSHATRALPGRSFAMALLVAIVCLHTAPACAGDPRACSITCGTADECPADTECGADGYCYLADQEPGSCSLDTVDAGQVEPDAADPPDAAAAASFAGEDAPDLIIPDDSTIGIETAITADVAGLDVQTVQVHLEIQHSWRGDLIVTLRSPAGETYPVVELLPEDSGIDLRGVHDVTGFTAGSPAAGDWTLQLVDRGPGDVGTLEYWSIGINEATP
jgi:hypothetical protein